MKNLLIYINPVEKKFTPEHDTLTKIQIDNSLRLGWQPQDILLVTNFDYQYRRVQSTVVDHHSVFDANRSTKIPAIIELFKRGLITNDLYWFHDHDAFQFTPFTITLDKDAGFTDHGAYSPTWNAGSFFFKKSAQDIFLTIWEYMNLRGTNEQNALTYIWQNNVRGINDRYQLMNSTYNIGIYKIPQNIQAAEKPIKVAHFHPHKRRHLDLFRPLLPPNLLSIFKHYGIS